METFRKILAIGDCNTLGAKSLEKKSYPERVGRLLGAEVRNLGHTMATTREGIHLLHNHLGDADCIFVQFGLVDSYTTFKYSPYILYYPDTFFRKQLRSIVKKYKKICRKVGLNALLGEGNVVPAEEYERNLRRLVELVRPRTVFLIETIPNKQLERNDEIRRYNRVMQTVSRDYENCFTIELYDLFERRLADYYQDSTHSNSAGYECIAQAISEQIHCIQGSGKKAC